MSCSQLVKSQLVCPLRVVFISKKKKEGNKSGCGYAFVAQVVDLERCAVVLKTGCVIDHWKGMHVLKKEHESCNRNGKKKRNSSWKHCLSKETNLPEWTLNLHYMSAVLPIAHDGDLRRNTRRLSHDLKKKQGEINKESAHPSRGVSQKFRPRMIWKYMKQEIWVIKTDVSVHLAPLSRLHN